ncbi:PKD domain-containing protein [Micromonospora profundi]|uniref:PKD domain-containing protein n=1 Tax=Micromonospora profundi TaxID=1420889 RepID=UPI0036B78246
MAFSGWHRLVAMLAISTLGVGLLVAPASAEPTSTTYGPDNPVRLESFYEPTPDGRAAADLSAPTSRAPLASSSVRRPPASPDADGRASECMDQPGVGSVEGRTHNRFLWCQSIFVGSRVYSIDRKVYVGQAVFAMNAVAYGRDDGNRTVEVFFRSVPGSLRYLEGDRGELANAIMMVFADCKQWLTGCSAGGPSAAKRFADWNVDGSWHSWTIASSEFQGVGPDKVNRHDWALTIDAYAPGTPDAGGEALPSHRIRCDTAQVGFSTRPKACIMDDVIPHLQYSLQSANYAQVSAHVHCAMTPGCQTWPGPRSDRVIPGRYTGSRDDPGLHRITEDFPVDASDNRTFYSKNSSAKNAACATLPAYILDRTTQQCDEFPFASTIEGAGKGDGNFSVLGVTSRHNSCAGNALARYYRQDRILVWQPGLPNEALDTYYVEITDVPTSSTDECLPPQDDPAEPNSPPTANAGPDTTGDEGFTIVLGGSVSDPDGGPPTAQWTYALGPDADPGMSCTFHDSRSANTTMRCNDDGAVTVTLTAFDGVNAAVSDSALVTVRNVDPRLRRLGELAPPRVAAAEDVEYGITSPQPWQVFRVGDAVPFKARFLDPGDNDTHSCAIEWDDGQTSTFDSYADRCEATHTFTHPGMYTIKPTITDDDGGASPAASVMVIVYDPNAGFVTQGGWLNSPAGALVDEPAVQGRLMVEFNPKYLPREPGPAPGGGKVAAALRGTGFDLASTTLEWLVVTPDQKAAVKGTGTIGGAAGYGFVAYGVDTPDAVRLVVWPLSAGHYPQQTLVYDNRPGKSYDLDLSDPQPLGGGSVQVHD